MNRGSVLTYPAEGGALFGFNEAPIHESGKSIVALSLLDFRSSFNEAPIHESGKLEGQRTVQVLHTGFNEAPIHESGKFDP